MKKISLSIMMAATLMFGSKATAQGPLEHLTVGLDAGLTGTGIHAATSLTPNLALRAGVNYIGRTWSLDEEFHGNRLDANGNSIGNGDVTGKFNDLKWTLFTGKALIDFFPVADGIFSITAGFYIGSNKVVVDGYTPESFEYAGIKLKLPNNVASNFDGTLVWGNVIKPYLGIGLGRTIPESRFAFRFDLGAMYAGGMKFTSSFVEGKEFNLNDINTSGLGDDTQAKILDFVKTGLNFYPQLSFSLSYRIF